MRQLTVLKIQILTNSKLFPQCNFGMLALCLALPFKLAIALLLVAIRRVTVYAHFIHPCMHDEST